MKKMLYICLLISSQLMCQQQLEQPAIDAPIKEFRCNCNNHDAEKREQAELNATMLSVLHGFAAIAGGMITIMQNPHDREQVGAQVNNMLRSLINIGVQASKSQRLSYRASESVHLYIEKLTEMLMPFILELVAECTQKMHVEAT